MDAMALEAVSLSKRYRIPGTEPSPRGGWLPVARLRRRGAASWMSALDDVSFRIGVGEGVGLIGPNGAGKSTLLKILSRVTRPSEGYADIHGRVGALLEVGTGFHPELTGRENVFLSGALLGLSRRDTRSRFDEIIQFSEIGQYLDVPVKRYSSGMYARLGFAVAAHLRPDILIVDEVLAVGDLAFQAKCLAHMKQLTQDGTTVLFVSHNLLAVADFCTRAIVMDHGRVAFDGAAGAAIAAYRRAVVDNTTAPREASQTIPLRINGRPTDGQFECPPHSRLSVDVLPTVPPEVDSVDVTLNLVIEAPDGRKAVHLRSDIAGERLTLRPGSNRLSVEIDDLPLVPGTYWLWLRLVSLDPVTPFIRDSERVLLIITGDQRLESLVHTRYRFREHRP